MPAAAPRTRWALPLLAWAALAWEASANCGSEQWFEAYGGERCYTEGDRMVIKCEANNGAVCGARMSSGEALGVGNFSLTLKAIPGSGAATTFYLSTNSEGMYSPEQGGWNEIDFEILGLMAGPSTKIWTNLFTGTAEEHHEMIEVPFDVSADFHTYTIEITEKVVRWIVDWKVYRTMEYSEYGDMSATVQESRFRRFLSVWGKASYEPLGACQEFTEALGQLDDNPGPFPLLGEFKLGVPERPAGAEADAEADATAGADAAPEDDADTKAEVAEADAAAAEATDPLDELAAQACKVIGCAAAADPAAPCQCHAGCKDAGDCCEDFDVVCPAAPAEAAGVVGASAAAGPGRPGAAPAAPPGLRRALGGAAAAYGVLAVAAAALRWRYSARDVAPVASCDQEAAALLSVVDGEGAAHA